MLAPLLSQPLPLSQTLLPPQLTLLLLLLLQLPLMLVLLTRRCR